MMNIALWIAQVLLALVFLVSGIAKSTFSRQQFINTKQTGVVDLPMPLVRFIGISEILGAIGLILPWLLRILPVLTPLSAICFAIMMILAARKHTALHEPKNVRNNLILLIVCLFVAFGRIFV
jgi:uncharacterized membrane protein YphA (DoxX/SURF4 family)